MKAKKLPVLHSQQLWQQAQCQEWQQLLWQMKSRL